MRMIDADELYRAVTSLWETSDEEDFEKGVFAAIENAPIIEERKKGEWIVNTYEHAREFWDRETTCSVCGYKMGGGTPNYCPNCGADMKGEQE